jgi:hypothetical protein
MDLSPSRLDFAILLGGKAEEKRESEMRDRKVGIKKMSKNKGDGRIYGKRCLD